MTNEQVCAMKKIFTPGTKIKLEWMKDPYALPDGSLGTVDFVDDAGQIQMKWDNGSSLALIYGEDIFRIIPSDCDTKYVVKVNIKMYKKLKIKMYKKCNQLCIGSETSESIFNLSFKR